MKYMGIALLSAGVLVAGSAIAAQPQWTYAQAGYFSTDREENTSGEDGYELAGSIEFAQKWHAQLRYHDAEDETNVDSDGYRITVGAHPAVSDQTQLIADITYFDFSVDGTPDVDTDGYGVGVGARSNITDAVELIGEIWWVESETDNDPNDDTDFFAEVGGRYHWTQNLSTGILLTLDSSDEVLFDVRWTFGGSVF
jgi:hypothetical protein